MTTYLQIKNVIKTSSQELIDKDFFLLKYDVSERAITHRFAIYLENQLKSHFPGYQVDCEYNRDGIGLGAKIVRMKEDSEKLGYKLRKVFPDVIVHKRGEQSGLIAIEIKKTNQSIDRDTKKLKAYKEILKYPHAFQIIFPVKSKTNNINLETLITEI